MTARTLSSSLLLLILCALEFSGCASSLYELPPPPKKELRRDVSLYPGEEQRARERDYLAARGAILRLSSLLSSKRYKEALGLMSAETRDLLSYLSPKRGEDGAMEYALSEGRLVLNGEVREFDPMEVLLASDLSSLKDSVKGQSEQETPKRKEIFAVVEGEKPRRIVMIKQGGGWVLHRTKIALD